MASKETIFALIETSHALRKDANAITDLIKTIAKGGAGLYGQIMNMGWALAPLAGGVGALTYAKATSPEGVADNADDILINENQKEVLAQSMRDLEALRKRKKQAALSQLLRTPHDRFIG